MKMMVKMAVLFATLLLITGVAFAQSWDCNCYEITATEVDNPGHTHTATIEICLEAGNESGYTCFPDGLISLSLFFEPTFLNKKILAYVTAQNSLGICVGSFKFHGSNKNVITGIGYCDGDQWTIWGHKTEGPCQTCG